MENDLAGVIDRDLQVKVNIEGAVHQGVFDFQVSLGCRECLSVGSHDDLVPVGINVALAERHWLREDVVTGAHQIDEEDLVVLDEAEDSLVEVASALGTERDDDSLGSVRFYDSLRHREREKVALVCAELETGWKIAIVDDVKEAIGGLLDLDLSELNRLGGELNVVAISLALAAKFNLVSTESGHFEKCATLDTGQLGSVSDSYFYDLTWADFAPVVINLNCNVRPVVLHLLNCVAGRNL